MRIGFIGVGNMGEAILRGALRGGVVRADEILAFDVYAPKLQTLQKELGVAICGSTEALITKADIIL